MAGILGAVTHNVIGVAGLAGGSGGTGGIRIMHLDAGWRDATGEWIDGAAAAQATDSAASWGAKVINMSFGALTELPALEAAIDLAVTGYGVIVIASAGNYSEGEPTDVMYPASYSNVIAVGATTPSDTRKELNDGTEWWWGSSYGPELDVMAPGVYIWTTDLTGSIGYSTGNYYDSFNGTSSAAPHTAGLAGLIRSVNPSLTWDQVRETVRLTADKVQGMGGANFHNEYGYGRINAFYAVAPPSPPTNLSVSGGVGQNPTLSWALNQEPDMKKYKIYRKIDGVDGSFKYLAYVNHPTTSYTDLTITIGRGNYVRYRIKAVDVSNQSSSYSNEASVKGSGGPQSKMLVGTLSPEEYSLRSNYPNPFNPVTMIKYDLPENSLVTLGIYDLMGREITTLVNGTVEAGYQNVIWDGKDSHGNPVSSGMYLYRLDALSRESDKEFHMTTKMVLLR